MQTLELNNPLATLSNPNNSDNILISCIVFKCEVNCLLKLIYYVCSQYYYQWL